MKVLFIIWKLGSNSAALLLHLRLQGREVAACLGQMSVNPAVLPARFGFGVCAPRANGDSSMMSQFPCVPDQMLCSSIDLLAYQMRAAGNRTVTCAAQRLSEATFLV